MSETQQNLKQQQIVAYLQKNKFLIPAKPFQPTPLKGGV
jgi:hypothetical protein